MANRRKAALVKMAKESPFSEVKIVDRPIGTKQQWLIAPEVKLIVETVETGQAVQLAARAVENMKNLRQWREQVRLGGLQAFTYFRGLLLSRRPLSEDDRQGLIDLLNAGEAHMVAMWETLDEIEQDEQMTRLASEKVRP